MPGATKCSRSAGGALAGANQICVVAIIGDGAPTNGAELADKIADRAALSEGC